ncbi:hypothetical protein [Micromonospora sp. NPDC051006]|uniref:hypothetical protein n=1 Tax=Micromonospora sp. NPDC051006 TaxID=3364283 RepID=UPI0037A6FCBF
MQALSDTGDVAFDPQHEVLVCAALRELRRGATRSPGDRARADRVAHQDER